MSGYISSALEDLVGFSVVGQPVWSRLKPLLDELPLKLCTADAHVLQTMNPSEVLL